MLPKISIVIVTWNIKEILKRCLDSVEQYGDVPYELFITDNNSEDGTKDFLANYKPQNSNLLKYEVIKIKS